MTARTPERKRMRLGRAVAFLAAVGLYVLVLGQNWGFYAAATMIAAYWQHGGRLLMPV